MKKLLIATIALFSLNTLADSSVGCGLGSLIWKKNSIVSALFRATTNASFSSQLFGITTGTSGCTQHSIVKRDMAPVYYAEANMENLRMEMAMGEGEYLEAFAATLGCEMSDQKLFNDVTKAQYETIFKTDTNTPAKMLNNVKSVINQNATLKNTCEYAVI